MTATENPKPQAHELETDPFTLEVIKSILIAIGDEMFIAMGRTSMSPIIYEVLDYAVGITDAEGNVISQGNGVTLFIGVLTHAVRSVLEKFGPSRLSQGDILAVNDPFTGGGTHLSDVCMVMPVFFEGELLAFAANKAHWTEVGGMAPGSWTTDSTEIYQEGLQFPCIKVFEAGVENVSITDLIRANVRTPEMSMGDFYAQCASLRLASNRIEEVCRRYGVHSLKDSIQSMFAHGRATAEQRLKELPKGVFEARLNIDDDGFGGDQLPVMVKVSITDNEFICDFTGSAPQARGPINCSYTGLSTGVRCLWLAISEPRYPVNEGIFAPVRMICPPGTVFTASKPAPTACYWESLLYVTDLVWAALAAHFPNRLSAGHFNTVGAEITTTFHPDTDEFTIIVEPNAGGWGARADGDGANGLFCVGDGETYNLPVEIMEQKFGFQMTRLALNDQDEGGEGRFRGGRGVIREFKVLHPRGGTFTITLGRSKEPPWGIDGGQTGGRNYFTVTHADGSVDGPRAKAARLALQKDDIVSIRCGAGGGWGDPSLRDRNLILEDVRAGLMSVDTARDVYGVRIESS
ncbi:MAG TPA: hydantoinase B/oxoprolinase family protein [Chloroflexota bacterium]|jgi:N-methylhydantoinase B|nr:hydantoinase B/oxoprolinase family protein [Chloroflexota bacterium]